MLDIRLGVHVEAGLIKVCKHGRCIYVSEHYQRAIPAGEAFIHVKPIFGGEMRDEHACA
jgi:hypothetical protein